MITTDTVTSRATAEAPNGASKRDLLGKQADLVDARRHLLPTEAGERR